MSCHPDLVTIINEALKVSPIDFGVAHGHRSPEVQNKLYQQGRTTPGKIVTHKDGFKKKSKHNHFPSMAIDIYCWPKKIMWDEDHLCVLGGVIIATAKNLKARGLIKHELRWGNDWNSDGVLVQKDPNERFIDLPHFELII